jgi:hypothetical protein
MRLSNHFLAAPLLTLILGSSAAAQSTIAAPSAAGRWEGSIAMPDGDVAIVVNLAEERGAWIGSITIPASTAADVPLDSFVMKGVSVQFHAGLLESPTFTGTLAPDGASIAGDVANARGAVAFHLKRAGEAKVNVPPPSSSFIDAKEIEGAWDAAIQAGTRTIRLALKVGPGPAGVASATLVTPEGLTLPITTITYKNRELSFESRAISGTFVGRLGDGGAITGEWAQPRQKVAVTFRRPAAS